MKVKIKLAPGASNAFTSTGTRFMADAEGCVAVEEFTQDHYDLLAQGGSLVAVEAPADGDDA